MKIMNLIPTPTEMSCSTEWKELKLTGVKIIGEAGEGLMHSLFLLDPEIPLSANGNLVIYNGCDYFTDQIKNETQALFNKRFAKKQGYYLAGNDGTVVIAAYNETGCMYAIMTLIQMYIGGKVPVSFEIKDTPDFLYRANKWLSWAECGMWSYDRGDGIEKYTERIIRKLDMALRYKVNTIVFDGFGWKSERFPGYNDLMRTLNREARKRKIHLLSSGYAMGYGMIGHGKGVYQGEAHMNRKSYPDGEVYQCIGSYNLGKPEDVVTGREYGTCISNEGLMREKLRELTSYIRNIEPGALYLHNMDADYILEPLWKARCDECRKKWPNDCLWAEDGAAGAFAYFINTLYEGIASVKTECYDAAKDCVVYIVSPGYIYMHAADENFEKARKFWQKVSGLLKHSENLFIGFRENYFDHNTGELRFDRLRDGWVNCDFASVYFCGGDGFYSDKLFLGGGLFNRLMKSATAVITENGSANQEAMQLYNAEYMWNCENSAYYNIPDMPDNYQEFEPFYINYLKTATRPEEIYGEGGLLEIICEKLYGKGAAKDFAELNRLHGKDFVPPLTSPCSSEIYTNFQKVVFPMRWDNEELPENGDISIDSILNKFREINKVTVAAAELSSKIYREKRYFTELEDDVKWMKENFVFCSALTRMLCEYMVCYQNVFLYFAKGDIVSSSTEESLCRLMKDADLLLQETRALNLQAIDHLGGAIARREELCDFIAYNSEIMLRSIKENTRIPSNLRPLPTRQWW